jgi:MoxR-like ATPase
MVRTFADAADATEVAHWLAPEYLADGRTALVLWLAEKLDRPVLVEGPPGVGKSDLGRAAAKITGRELLRLQCYEGLDEGKALYEWNYARQMLSLQIARGAEATSAIDAFYTEDFLLQRPLLQALRAPTSTVLLIDEVDRGEPEFEAMLLEFLAERQISVPELGTVKALSRPLILLTTNGEREMSDALRRRCLHLHLDYPTPSQESAILELRIPGIARALAEAVARFVADLRKLDLQKRPSVSESVDWARAILLLGGSSLKRELVQETLSILLKHQEDVELAIQKVDALLTTR